MKSLCFYFQIHETLELQNYNIFSIGFNNNYFDTEKTKQVLANKITQSYLPMNELLMKLFKQHGSKFKVSFSISGSTLDLFEKHFPEILDSFIELSKTGNVEFLAETNNHSLSSLFSKEEFEKQVILHQEKIKKYFNQTPSTFRNSELLYSNEIGALVSGMGFDTVLTQGVNSVLKFKTPNTVYHTSFESSNLTLLMGNSELSFDIEEHFGDTSWTHYPLQAPIYVGWIKESLARGSVVNIWLDYSVFGFTHKQNSGIFDFFEHVVLESLKSDILFTTPSEINSSESSPIDIPTTISWSNTFDDEASWLGNSMQKQAAAELYELGSMVYELQDSKLTSDFRELTNSDYFYNMCTHLDTSYSFHGNFSHHSSPYESYIFYMNILRDLAIRIRGQYELLLKERGDTLLTNDTSLEELRVHAMK
jgi:alpha-amylase